MLKFQTGIYPIETLKVRLVFLVSHTAMAYAQYLGQTQMMSSTGDTRRSMVDAAKRIWGLGGFRAYYRGLGVRVFLAILCFIADGTLLCRLV